MKKTEGKAGRPVIKHGAFSYLTRLSLPDNRAYLRPYLSSVREGLVRDLGPIEEDLTTAQKLIVDRIVSLTGVIRLIEEFCREQGVFNGAVIQPVLANNFLAFNSSLRLNLQALGIPRGPGESGVELGKYIFNTEAPAGRAESPVEARSTAPPTQPYGGKSAPYGGKRGRNGVSRGKTGLRSPGSISF